MSVPVKYSLEMYRGDSFRMQFRLWADAAKTEPVDLTGATAAAQIRPAPAADPAASLLCVITDNVIDVSLPASETVLLPGGAYWDLQVTYASGDVQTLVSGGVAVRGEITQPMPGMARRRKPVLHA